MNDKIKTAIATAIATGALLGGGNAIVKEVNCTYTIKYQDKEICIDKEAKDAIGSQLQPNAGFGGVSFSEKK